jgi:hypothetical protein
VRGEDRRRADRFESLLEGQPLIPDEFADPFDPEESGVALIGVVDVRGRRTGEPRPQPQGANPPDTEQDLLLDAPVTAAAVEGFGDVLGRFVVVGDVGVQEQQGHPADLRPPDVGTQDPRPRKHDLDDSSAAIGLTQQGQRHTVRIEHRVGRLLPAVAIERLLEVAGLVEQADPDDRHTEIGSRLQVVAGEDAQAAGVLREDVGDAELRAEVGNRGRRLQVGLGGPALVPAGFGHVGVQVGAGRRNPGDEVGVVGQCGEFLGGQAREQANGVGVDLRPADRIDAAEELACVGVPGEPQVAGKVTEHGDGLGQDGTYAETADGFHGGSLYVGAQRAPGVVQGAGRDAGPAVRNGRGGPPPHRRDTPGR